MAEPVEVGSLWASSEGREVLEIRRVWFDEDNGGWNVRGHPIKGGRPLVTTLEYLQEAFTNSNSQIENDNG